MRHCGALDDSVCPSPGEHADVERYEHRLPVSVRSSNRILGRWRRRIDPLGHCDRTTLMAMETISKRAATAWGAFAGLGAAILALGTADLVAGLKRNWKSPVLDVGDRVIDHVPVFLKEFAIETFGQNDKPVLLAGIGVFLAIYAAVIGASSFRSRHRRWRHWHRRVRRDRCLRGAHQASGRITHRYRSRRHRRRARRPRPVVRASNHPTRPSNRDQRCECGSR